MRNELFIFVGMALLVGCDSAVALKTPLGPDVDNGDLREIHEMAVQETGCTREPMVYSHVQGRLHRMEGCGKQADYVMACEGYCGWLKVSDLKRRATFEMNCQDVTVLEISEGTWGVQGCGNRATYLYVHKGWGAYEWVMNSASTPVATAN